MTVETPRTLTRYSPLSEWRDTLAQLPEGLQVRELPFLTQLTLRLQPGSPAAKAVEACLDITLPGPLRAREPSQAAQHRETIERLIQVLGFDRVHNPTNDERRMTNDDALP